MELTGEVWVPAPRAVVFAALSDRQAISAAIPGRDQGLVGRLELGACTAPDRISYSGLFGDAVSGSVSGHADILLEEAGGQTRLAYALAISRGGTIARLTAEEALDQARSFIESFLAHLIGRIGIEPTVAAPPLATPGPDEAAESELVGRIEQRVDDEAGNIGEIVEGVGEEVEVAAGRGFLGGPYVWGLIALLAVIVFLATLR